MNWTGGKVAVACLLSAIVGFFVGGGPYAAAQGGGDEEAEGADVVEVRHQAIEVQPPTEAEAITAALHACRQSAAAADALVERLQFGWRIR